MMDRVSMNNDDLNKEYKEIEVQEMDESLTKKNLVQASAQDSNVMNLGFSFASNQFNMPAESGK